ncbi:hypothetical protein EJ04DRAFT_567001 [Polyplosphaeria fusca]|uniref:LYC1 C-terminal domain-containing protein n=1 Tax=Polyplosphaeria fusca TaxID=682080 RepID=A0A9P4QTX5_9PLEO|nr:hypothetical protein EJ04DRAFT_567001 [Polyplosphaeria fusca]
MEEQPALYITTSDKHYLVHFAEATLEQRIACYKPGATSFRHPLSEAQFIERETHLSQHPLTTGPKWRFWCVFPANSPQHIVATCRTVHRDVLIGDAHGVHEAHITEFYSKRGWHPVHCTQSQISATLVAPVSKGALPKTRLLTRVDVPGLCARDLQAVRSDFQRRYDRDARVSVLVLPTERAAFIGAKRNGRPPTAKGSVCDETGTWLYWNYDFRRKQLYLQKVVEGDASEAALEGVVSLLLDACEEAARWRLLVVSAWNASALLLGAMDVLRRDFHVDVRTEERVDSDTTSIRLRGAEAERGVESPEVSNNN